VEIYPNLTFIDQGENLEEIICPLCKTALQHEICSEDETNCEKVLAQIDEQSECEKLEIGIIKMPCCNVSGDLIPPINVHGLLEE